MKSRKYRCKRICKVSDEEAMGAWSFEYLTEKYGWRQLRNYGMKAALKRIAITHKLVEMEFEWSGKEQTELF